MSRLLAGFLLSLAGITMAACVDLGGTPGFISSDSQLFDLVTRIQPFSGYILFPRVDSVTTGTLNGSNAHQPAVRVSMNATAYSALRNGQLPNGETFPDGSVIFKEIRVPGRTVLYAVMFKDKSNPLNGAGWLWAEFEPDGTTTLSISGKGSACTGCHGRELGPGHDLVRTFERQH